LAKAEVFLMFTTLLDRFKLTAAYPVGEPPTLDYEMGLLFYPKPFDIVATRRY